MMTRLELLVVPTLMINHWWSITIRLEDGYPHSGLWSACEFGLPCFSRHFLFLDAEIFTDPFQIEIHNTFWFSILTHFGEISSAVWLLVLRKDYVFSVGLPIVLITGSMSNTSNGLVSSIILPACNIGFRLASNWFD